MSQSIGKQDDTFYVLEESEYLKLKSVRTRLMAGTDRERDQGTKLDCILDNIQTFNGLELFLSSKPLFSTSEPSFMGSLSTVFHMDLAGFSSVNESDKRIVMYFDGELENQMGYDIPYLLSGDVTGEHHQECQEVRFLFRRQRSLRRPRFRKRPYSQKM